MNIRVGMSMRDALQAARELGCTIEQDTSHARGGQLVVSHPSFPFRVHVRQQWREPQPKLVSLLRALDKKRKAARS